MKEHKKKPKQNDNQTEDAKESRFVGNQVVICFVMICKLADFPIYSDQL